MTELTTDYVISDEHHYSILKKIQLSVFYCLQWVMSTRKHQFRCNLRAILHCYTDLFPTFSAYLFSHSNINISLKGTNEIQYNFETTSDSFKIFTIIA